MAHDNRRPGDRTQQRARAARDCAQQEEQRGCHQEKVTDVVVVLSIRRGRTSHRERPTPTHPGCRGGGSSTHVYPPYWRRPLSSARAGELPPLLAGADDGARCLSRQISSTHPTCERLHSPAPPSPAPATPCGLALRKHERLRSRVRGGSGRRAGADWSAYRAALTMRDDACEASANNTHTLAKDTS